MSDHLTPFQVCLRIIGPEAVIAGILLYERTAPYGWHNPSKYRDAGDLPSPRVQRRLLAYARARGLPLTPEHLIWGASAAEIEALLEHQARPEPVNATATATAAE